MTYAGAMAVYYIICYVFLGIGLYTMARRRNMQAAFLAWVPIANTYLMGKLIGEINVFGIKVKNIGLIGVITGVVYAGVAIANEVIYVDLLKDVWTDVINEGSKFHIYGYKTVDTITGEVLKEVPGEFYSISTGVTASILMLANSLTQLIDKIVCFTILLFMFRNYAPKSSFLFAILSIFFNILGPIFVFAIRNNSCEEYREYMKMKMHSIYGGGNPYQYGDGSYRDPFDLSKQGDKKEEKPENPFPEYDDKK